MGDFRQQNRYKNLDDPQLASDIAAIPVNVDFTRKFVARTYIYMFLALAVTALTSYFVASTSLITYIFGNAFIFWGLIISEFVLVIYLSSSILKLSTGAALFWFLLYSVINGATLSSIFLIYTKASIFTTLLVTSAMFLVMSIVGFTTKSNLLNFGGYLMTGLIGLIIASVVNIFLKSSSLYWIISCAGVFIFTVLIFYSTQKLKLLAGMASFEQNGVRFTVLAALDLYLNFINLLLYVLRFLGKKR